MSAEEQNDYGYGLDFGRSAGTGPDWESDWRPEGPGADAGAPGCAAAAVPQASGPVQLPPGQVPDQAGMPSRETLSASAAFPQGRVPGQAPAGRGGVTPEAFVGAGAPARPTVPAPADPVDGERPPSDAELTALVRAGDDTAYEEIYRRHVDSVRRYARTCCRDSFTAEDLAGEVFARTLQALRAGKGPEFAVRAYLLTAVRNVAAAWTRSERREQLVDDFSVFAQTSAAVVDLDLADPGADAWAMAMADQRMVMQAYAELPEDDRMVLWHTEVERESPKTVAVMLGKTANATAVQAHRARDRLAAGFLQAHVSGSQDRDCEGYANRLGAYARGSLRKRASAEVGRHLKECDRCTAACLELSEINHGLRALLPGGVLVWVGVGGFGAAAAAVGGAAVVGGAAAGTAAATAGGAAGGAATGATSGAAAGAAGTAGGAAGGAAGGGGGAGAGAGAAGEGLGTAAKAGIAAAIAVAAAAVAAYALTGSPEPKPPVAAPPVAAPVSPAPPAPAPEPAAPEPAPKPAPASAEPAPAEEPAPEPSPPAASPAPSKPAPPAAPSAAPAGAAPAPSKPAPPKETSAPSPSPTPVPTKPQPPVLVTPQPSLPPLPTPEVPVIPTPEVPVIPTPTFTPSVPTPTPPLPPTDFWADSLPVVKPGNNRVPPPQPSIRQKGSDWFWQRDAVSVGGTEHLHGITVHAPATTLIDLNRTCTSFDAVAGMDDLSVTLGGVVFSVQSGDGRTLWSSRTLRAGDAAVPVHVPLDGQKSIRLVVTPASGVWSALNVADWAEARFRCV
ncbi:sigma-70 family RNA polymerase sigma factor [Kitasatospora sp. NPDC002551]|uniref:sigma-70 family RNA polymerase sigma factor n=1 Tax=Kitasatospora sp. NPDC002551 TaxID=3154539 RepID=UPI0033273801